MIFDRSQNDGRMAHGKDMRCGVDVVLVFFFSNRKEVRNWSIRNIWVCIFMLKHEFGSLFSFIQTCFVKKSLRSQPTGFNASLKPEICNLYQ